MIAAVDVCYDEQGGAVAACVLFHAFSDAQEARVLVERVTGVLPYEPGSFYKRELPCVLQVLRAVGSSSLDVARRVEAIARRIHRG